MLSYSTNTHTTTDRLANEITPTGVNVYFYCLHSGGVGEKEWGREPSWFVYIIVCIKICMLALIISGPCSRSIVTEYPPHSVCRQGNNKNWVGRNLSTQDQIEDSETEYLAPSPATSCLALAVPISWV